MAIDDTKITNSVAIPNTNGAIPTVNANDVPLGTGLVRTQFARNLNQNNIQNQIAAQLGPDGLGLGFGTITVINDLLTVDPHLSTRRSKYGDSINFFGVYHIGSAMSRLYITGGTGKYLHACGFAEVQSLIPACQIVADAVESLLRLP
nr:dirigent protein 16-like [Tanacetum cinerariifolium]